MSITGIGNSTLAALSSLNNKQSGRTPSVVPAEASATTSHISKPAELLQKLEQLQQQDPAQFKQVLSQLSDSLQTVAQQSGDSNGVASKLASAFKSAAETGDLSTVQSALTPPSRQNLPAATTNPSGTEGTQRMHHGHGHHGGGGAIGEAFANALSQIDAALQSSNSASVANTT